MKFYFLAPRAGLSSVEQRYSKWCYLYQSWYTSHQLPKNGEFPGSHYHYICNVKMKIYKFFPHCFTVCEKNNIEFGPFRISGLEMLCQCKPQIVRPLELYWLILLQLLYPPIVIGSGLFKPSLNNSFLCQHVSYQTQNYLVKIFVNRILCRKKLTHALLKVICRIFLFCWLQFSMFPTLMTEHFQSNDQRIINTSHHQVTINQLVSQIITTEHWILPTLGTLCT